MAEQPGTNPAATSPTSGVGGGGMVRGGSERRGGAKGERSRMYQFKLVLLGESAVGKSSLVLRFVKGQFHDYQESTIGAAFLTQKVVLSDAVVKFEIWDTAGQERYHSLAPMYYRGAQAAIVMYDITSRDSFARALTWIAELQKQASPNILIALAGNKTDLETQRAVSPEEGQALADQTGIIFMETSAKSAMNVEEIFATIARKLPKSDPGAPGGGAGAGQRGGGGVDLSARGGADQRTSVNCCN